MTTRPEGLLKALAPWREALVVAVDCLFPWYWLAALGAQAQMPFVLGQALYRKALHGGKAKNDQLDSQKIAGLLRGGRLPPADGSPAARRAPRALLRRRCPLPRQRAALRAHVQPTTSQATLPESGPKLAYKANRAGVAERFPEPAGPKSVAGALALLADEERLRRAVALTILQTAKAPKAPALERRPAVPGRGKSVRGVLL